jgi:hypothetical protein
MQELDEKRPSTIVVDGIKYQKHNNVHGASFEYSAMRDGLKMSFLFSRDGHGNDAHYICRIYAKDDKKTAGPVASFAAFNKDLSSAFTVTDAMLSRLQYELNEHVTARRVALEPTVLDLKELTKGQLSELFLPNELVKIDAFMFASVHDAGFRKAVSFSSDSGNFRIKFILSGSSMTDAGIVPGSLIIYVDVNNDVDGKYIDKRLDAMHLENASYKSLNDLLTKRGIKYQVLECVKKMFSNSNTKKTLQQSVDELQNRFNDVDGDDIV